MGKSELNEAHAEWFREKSGKLTQINPKLFELIKIYFEITHKNAIWGIKCTNEFKNFIMDSGFISDEDKKGLLFECIFLTQKIKKEIVELITHSKKTLNEIATSGYLLF